MIDAQWAPKDMTSSCAPIANRGDDLHVEISSHITELLGSRLYGSLQINALAVKLQTRINEFETEPSSLDSHLDSYIRIMTRAYLSCRKISESTQFTKSLALVVYCFCKVRGYKVVVSSFDTDIYSLAELCRLYGDPENDENESYMLSLWLSNMMLAPFPLETTYCEVLSQLMTNATSRLGSAYASKSQFGALVLLARILTRQNCFISTQEFYDIYITPVWSSTKNHETEKLGFSMVLHKILKICGRDVGQYLSDRVFHEILLADSIYLDYQAQNSLSVLYCVKLLTRIAHFFLSSGKYLEVSKIITIITQIMGKTFVDEKLRYSIAKSLASICRSLSHKAVNYQFQLIDFLLIQLCNIQLSTIESAPIFTPDLPIDMIDTSVQKAHSLLLFFGLIDMNRAMPTEAIPLVLSVAHKYLFYEGMRGISEQGNCLRDASCFIVWAVCRSLTSETAKQLHLQSPDMFQTIFHDMIQVAIFDPDLIIRRCGISVLQELVGRHAKYCLQARDAEQLGQFSVELIELMTFQAVAQYSGPYVLVKKLLDLKIEAEVLFETLFRRMLDQDSGLELQRRCISTVSEVYGHRNVDATFWSKFCGELISAFQKKQSEHLFFCIVSLAFQMRPLRKFLMNYSIDIPPISPTDYHETTPIGREAYILSAIFCKKFGLLFETSKVWNSLAIVTLGSDGNLATLLKDYLILYSPLSDEEYDMALTWIEHGNRIWARSLSIVKASGSQFDKLIALLHDRKVSCEVKALILDSFASSSPVQLEDPSQSARLVECLDNYTLTEQGDVGSEVRNATLQLIQSRPTMFEPLSFNLRLRLIRISGEHIDRLRLKAFEILSGIKPSSLLTAYFGTLFDYYESKIMNDRELSTSFWKGIVFSAAATRGSIDTINTSFRAVLQFFKRLSATKLSLELLTILDILVVPKETPLRLQPRRMISTYTNTVNLCLKLLDSGFSFPTDFDYTRLFVRCYNLHINTTNLTRLKLVLRVFFHLGTPEYGSITDARKRVCWVACHHRNTHIRQTAALLLYEMAIATNSSEQAVQMLEKCDFTDEKTAKLQYAVIEPIFINLPYS